MKKLKFVWKNEYYGYLSFVLGFVLFCLASLWIWFSFMAIFLFLFAGVWNCVFSIKFYNKEKNAIYLSFAKIIEEKKQNLMNDKSLSEEELKQIDENPASLLEQGLLKDFRKYKVELIIKILCYIGVCLAAISLFLLLLF